MPTRHLYCGLLATQLKAEKLSCPAWIPVGPYNSDTSHSNTPKHITCCAQKMYESLKQQKRAPDERGHRLSGAAHAPLHAAGQPDKLHCCPLAGLIHHTPCQDCHMTKGPCCVPHSQGPYAGYGQWCCHSAGAAPPLWHLAQPTCRTSPACLYHHVIQANQMYQGNALLQVHRKGTNRALQ